MKFIRKNNNYYEGVVYEWNLPSGFTCPCALECLVKVDRKTGIFNNKSKGYKCYSAMAERFPAVREHRWKNFEHIKNGGDLKIPDKAEAVRVHASGDFFSQKYFDLWIRTCEENKKVEFWAYTKSLKFWINRINDIPDNLTITASRGGRLDKLIDKYNLKNNKIVKSIEEANNKNLPIDTNDNLARQKNINFALVDNFAKPLNTNQTKII